MELNLFARGWFLEGKIVWGVRRASSEGRLHLGKKSNKFVSSLNLDKILSLKKENTFSFCSLTRIFALPLHHENDDKEAYFCGGAVGSVPANVFVVVFSRASRGAWGRWELWGVCASFATCRTHRQFDGLLVRLCVVPVPYVAVLVGTVGCFYSKEMDSYSPSMSDETRCCCWRVGHCLRACSSCFCVFIGEK